MIYQSFPKHKTHPLQMLQNPAACIISGTTRHSHIMPTLQLHSLPVHAHTKFKILLTVLKIIHRISPDTFQSLMHKDPENRIKRTNSKNSLIIPKTKIQADNMQQGILQIRTVNMESPPRKYKIHQRHLGLQKDNKNIPLHNIMDPIHDTATT